MTTMTARCTADQNIEDASVQPVVTEQPQVGAWLS